MLTLSGSFRLTVRRASAVRHLVAGGEVLEVSHAGDRTQGPGTARI